MEYAPSLSHLKEIPNFLNHGLLVYAGGKTIIRLTEELGGGGLLQLNDKKTASSITLGSFPGIVDLKMKATDRDREEAYREMIDLLTGRGGKRLAKPTSKNNWITATATAKWSRLSIQQKGKFRAVLGDFEFKKARTGVVEIRPASSLVLLDEKGKVIWSAP